MKNIIVIMGGPGSGKGTLASGLQEIGKYTYIETGALFRNLAERPDIAKLIADGNFVPDDQVFDFVKNLLNSARDDVLLDGFPRTLAQAKWLVENFADVAKIKVLYLDTPEWLLRSRINKRLNEGSARADDKDITVISQRLERFVDRTVPAIEFLKTVENIEFYDIDTTIETAAVFARAKEIMGYAE